MKQKKLTFKEIAKLIHPDLNPNIKEASEKMTKAVQYSDNEIVLYRLATKWGLIKDKDLNVFSVEYKIGPGKNLKIYGKNCVIVDVIFRNGNLDVYVWHRKENQFKRYVRIDEYDQDKDFFVTEICKDHDYDLIDLQYQSMKYGV